MPLPMTVAVNAQLTVMADDVSACVCLCVCVCVYETIMPEIACYIRQVHRLVRSERKSSERDSLVACRVKQANVLICSQCLRRDEVIDVT